MFYYYIGMSIRFQCSILKRIKFWVDRIQTFKFSFDYLYLSEYCPLLFVSDQYFYFFPPIIYCCFHPLSMFFGSNQCWSLFPNSILFCTLQFSFHVNKYISLILNLDTSSLNSWNNHIVPDRIFIHIMPSSLIYYMPLFEDFFIFFIISDIFFQ